MLPFCSPFCGEIYGGCKDGMARTPLAVSVDELGAT